MGGSGQGIEGAIIASEASAPIVMPTQVRTWESIIRAWAAELHQRTGSKRTPVECVRYAEHFRDALANMGRDLTDATRLSPLADKHINMLGRYAFAPPAGPALRPLRDPASPGND